VGDRVPIARVVPHKWWYLVTPKPTFPEEAPQLVISGEEGEGLASPSPPLTGGPLKRVSTELSHLVYECITYGVLVRECEAQGLAVPDYSTQGIDKQVAALLWAFDEDNRWHDDVDSVFDEVAEVLAHAAHPALRQACPRMAEVKSG